MAVDWSSHSSLRVGWQVIGWIVSLGWVQVWRQQSRWTIYSFLSIQSSLTSVLDLRACSAPSPQIIVGFYLWIVAKHWCTFCRRVIVTTYTTRVSFFAMINTPFCKLAKTPFTWVEQGGGGGRGGYCGCRNEAPPPTWWKPRAIKDSPFMSLEYEYSLAEHALPTAKAFILVYSFLPFRVISCSPITSPNKNCQMSATVNRLGLVIGWIVSNVCKQRLTNVCNCEQTWTCDWMNCVSPWYNRNAWLGVKTNYPPKYLPTYLPICLSAYLPTYLPTFLSTFCGLCSFAWTWKYVYNQHYSPCGLTEVEERKERTMKMSWGCALEFLSWNIRVFPLILDDLSNHRRQRKHVFYFPLGYTGQEFKKKCISSVFVIFPAPPKPTQRTVSDNAKTKLQP